MMKPPYCMYCRLLLLLTCTTLATASDLRAQPTFFSQIIFPLPPSHDSCQLGIVMEIAFESDADTTLPAASVYYPWLAAGSYRIEEALVRQIPPPECFRRLPVPAGSFAEWLRFLPLDTLGKPILLYDGCEKALQAGGYQNIRIDIGNEDLQQCADAAMRLVSEYHFSRQQYHRIHFNFTSGHRVSFDDWRRGRKARVLGHRKVFFTAPTDSVDNSYTNLKAYFNTLFMYAGSYSLSKELTPKPLDSLQAGDFFVRGGFPGHVVLVADVAVHPQTGEKVFLLLQGGMPAQNIHIFRNPNDPERSPWYTLPIPECLYIPGYDFEINMLYRSRGD